MSSIHIYWDESHIWGLLLWRALHSLGIEHQMVRASDIAEGCLERDRPAALMVPGGTARRKFLALGDDGVEAVRNYVRDGGAYLGFCGGAGLGLSGRYGLGLCPWKRRGFTDRLQHTMSGHMQMRVAQDSDLVPAGLSEKPLLPVWWPGRFEYDPDTDVNVLAAYDAPGPDFWVADLPLTSVPKATLDDLETQYEFSIWPQFMEGQPCMVEGSYGKGRYVLSYSHLETPASRDANLWFGHLIQTLTGIEVGPGALTPAWNLESLKRRWPSEDGGDALSATKAGLEESLREGMNELLLFKRNSWLLGWRRGIPGGYLNSLYSMICQTQNLVPSPAARAHWQELAPHFLETLELFRHGLSGYLLSERLGMTVSGTDNAIPEDVLKEQRMALFGRHMDYGGLFAELITVLDEVLWLILSDQGNS